jgi:hypothetical protein
MSFLQILDEDAGMSVLLIMPYEVRIHFSGLPE